MEEDLKISWLENPSLVSILQLLLALSYTYFLVSKLVPKGIPRILALAPVFYVFYLFPWCFPYAFTRGLLSLFITWITSFKLLLFCFDRGPLSQCKNLIDFILISIFPLKIAGKPSDEKRYYEMEEIFRQPYLATSFQDFWGRRWNRYSSKMLRSVVYDPTLETLKGLGNTAKLLATLATFVVSALMHQLMFYYITCGLTRPSFEVMLFFVLQGVCIFFERVFQARNWVILDPTVSVNLKRVFITLTFIFLLVLPVARDGNNTCERPKNILRMSYR